MKYLSKQHQYFLRLMVFVLCTLEARTPLAQTDNQTFSLAFNQDWPPFSYELHQTQSKPSGLFYEILHEAIKNRLQISLTADTYPWGRVQHLVKSELYDGLISVPTTERREFLEVSTMVFPVFLDIFVSKKSEHYPFLLEQREISALSELVACEIRGNQSSIERYQSNGFQNVVLVTNYNQCFEMILIGRVDFVAAPPDLQLPSPEKANLLKQIPLKMPSHHHLMIRKNSEFAAILPELNGAIEAMHADGFIKSIAEKYKVTYQQEQRVN